VNLSPLGRLPQLEACRAVADSTARGKQKIRRSEDQEACRFFRTSTVIAPQRLKLEVGKHAPVAAIAAWRATSGASNPYRPADTQAGASELLEEKPLDLLPSW
jgi:hypothetical protein